MASKKFVGFRIDIETRSRTPVKFGAYRYSEDPDFRVLIIGYTPIWEYVDGTRRLGGVRCLDLTDQKAVAEFTRVITDSRYEKHAFNANFERICLSQWIGLPNGTYIDPENWHCSAIKAHVNGVFGTLDEVARAMRSPVKKDAEGKRLIRRFTTPDPKTGKFTEPEDAPLDFLRFKAYCEQDVVTEAVAVSTLADVPPEQQAEYEADQRINDRGFRHFKGLSQQAVAQVRIEQARLMADLKRETGLKNPNSIQQMRRWLEDQDYPMQSLDKVRRAQAELDPECPPHVVRVLQMKGAASLSSVQKHQAALSTRCADGRIRGSLQFYGAHTGREAGRGIQPQNLPRYEAPLADRRLLVSGNAGRRAPEIAKGTVRSSIVPARDHVFVTADYNAIEARCLGWQAGEAWVQSEFAGEGKIYEATASTMFGVDKAQLVLDLKACDKCGKASCFACVTRGKGKVSNLALGYQGGAGALVTMGAEEAGIDIGNYKMLHAEWEACGKPGRFHEWERDRHDYPELLRLRDLYRNASPATVRFWKNCAKAWDVACSGKSARFGPNQSIAMVRDGKNNRLILPSGRSIWYRSAVAHRSDRDPKRIDRRTFIGKGAGIGHVRTDTHGGKLTENVTQAIARDILFDLIMRIENYNNYPGRIVLHVHDEVVLEVHKNHADQVLADVIGLMGKAPDWADGLLVKGEGSIMERYGK